MTSQIQLIATSFKRLVGRDILTSRQSEAELEFAIENANAVIVSHGVETDPIFNYGNQSALTLFELSLENFIQLPSRYSAEAMERGERERMLEAVNRQGYIDDYRGIRVSSTGKRFWIEQAYVWNLTDEVGTYFGQAAMFDNWTKI